MVGQIFELPENSGIRKYWKKLTEKAEVIDLDVEHGCIRDDDVYECASCTSTYFRIERDGTISCGECKEPMHVRWFDPTDPSGDAA